MAPATLERIDDELDVLASMVSLSGQRIIELGCGAAHLARALLGRFPDSELTGVEVDARQHAKNLASPQQGLQFVAGVAQDIAAGNATYDLALMLKSLHHVPIASMDQALREVARVVRPGGHLYVSEPIYDGALNDVVKPYNDEGVVRAAAQAAIDAALQAGIWTQTDQRRFVIPRHFSGFADFEQRMIQQTYADHRLAAATLAEVRRLFEQHLGPDGATFEQPMHVRLLRRPG
ncbi:class I SAM-dependent methyltransferase [Comamonadaceae bacterium G21597-S1]|nr:class I SAM-dependent methyltransferase [Comamonadaceae bacterium G21597-S1]